MRVLPSQARMRKRRKEMNTAAEASLAIDIIVRSPLWKGEAGVDSMLRQVIGRAASMLALSSGELAVVLADNAVMRRLNREWRGRDTATNVLSFPSLPQSGAATRMLGDIVIAYETVTREARTQGKPFKHHLAHLAVHGFLHLAGYDHAAEVGALAMERLEVAILDQLGVSNPYSTCGGKARR
jgi:probable rRNA maturation factor